MTSPPPGRDRKSTSDPQPTELPPESTPLPRTVRSDELFQGAREIVIEHEGVCYRLRLTKSGKLLLNK